MRVYLRLFLALLIPVSFIAASLLTLYFSFEHSLYNAISLGILYGLFYGVILDGLLTVAFIYLKNGHSDILNRLKRSSNKNHMQEEQEEIEAESSQTQHQEEDDKIEHHLPPDDQIMLLMNKELVFEVIISGTKKHITRSIVKHNIDKGTISIKTRNEFISINVKPLTKHTSEISINTVKDSKYTQELILFLKEKEQSFLEY